MNILRYYDHTNIVKAKISGGCLLHWNNDDSEGDTDNQNLNSNQKNRNFDFFDNSFDKSQLFEFKMYVCMYYIWKYKSGFLIRIRYKVVWIALNTCFV